MIFRDFGGSKSSPGRGKAPPHVRMQKHGKQHGKVLVGHSLSTCLIGWLQSVLQCKLIIAARPVKRAFPISKLKLLNTAALMNSRPYPTPV